MTPCQITAGAETDVENIYRNLLLKSPTAAARFGREFDEAISLLQEYPDIGHKRPDLTKLNFLFWNFERYNIIYRRFKNKTSIQTVMDSRMDIKRKLR